MNRLKLIISILLILLPVSLFAGSKADITGILSVKGTDRFQTIVLKSQGSIKYMLKADLALKQELLALQGLELKLSGRLIEGSLPTFRVESYKLLNNGYDIALVGILTKEALLCERGKKETSPCTIMEISDDFLDENAGALIWVLGEKISLDGVEEFYLRARKYGVIKKQNKGSI